MTAAARELRYSGPGGAGVAAVRGRTAPGPARDRWLLMRLLDAARSTPRLADRLLAELGSLGGVLATSDERLLQLGADENGIAMLRLLREALAAVLEPRPDSRPRIDRPEALLPRLHAEMAWLRVEQVRAAFLDAGQRLIGIEIMGAGSIRSSPVYPREIARRSLELSAAAVILVHNHPSGDPRPSAEDLAISRDVASALQAIDVRLLDHLVVARGGWASALPRNGAGISTVRISTAQHCAPVSKSA